MGEKLTLGILVFNQGKYVSALLDSVGQQTYRNCPLVIVDNSSSDDSLEQIEASLFRNSLEEHTTIIRNERNYGSAEGLRQLLENSSTKYLSVIHGDDILESNYVETVMRTLSTGYSCNALNITLMAFPNTPSISVPKKFYRPLWVSNTFVNRILVCGLNPGVMPGSVLDRDFVLNRNFLNFESHVNGVEDTLLWMRIIRSGGKIQSLFSPCYKYRIHESQFSYSDSRNSFYYGFARRIIIQESKTFIEGLLSKAEISHEIKRFGISSGYVEGLGPEYFSRHKIFSLLRVFNICVRRLALMSVARRYRYSHPPK
jgi:glycosyltransferase involved in cell wall biosynthesis